MKRKLIIIALLIFFGLNNIVFAQDPSLAWAKGMGGSSDEFGNSIAVDGNGNVYTTGYFQGTVDFDPGPGIYNLTSSGGNNIFVSKLDASGNFLWAKQMGNGGGGAQSFSIALDANGNVYTTGGFFFTADFDPGSGTSNMTATGNSEDIFISKLDASGNFVWARQLSGGDFEEGISIAIDPNGYLYTTGIFKGTVDFDPGANTYNLTSAGDFDVFISKLDLNGNFIWAKQIGGINQIIASSIAIDLNGNVLVTGNFVGTADFDPGSGTFNMTPHSGGADVFVAKLDASGSFTWAKQLGGTAGSTSHSLAVDANGNVYTTGYFGNSDFDPGPGIYNLSSFGGDDIFVSKLDASGNFVWAKQMGGTFDDVGYSIAVDNNQNVYIAGYFSGVADFDPGAGTYNLTSAGGYDIYISKLDASGNFLWAKNMGGAGADYGFSVTIDANENIFATGSFSGTADFDPGTGTSNLISAGGFDIFVVKLGEGSIIFTQPKIYTSKGSLVVNDIQTITGNDFTASGQINLYIINSVGDLIPTNNSFTYLPNGGFSYQLPIVGSMPGGEYNVYATDVTTGVTTSTIKFIVNTFSQNTLWINKPLANDTYLINQLFQVQWGDYISKSLAIGKSGFVQKKYKVAVSNDNGATWFSENDVTINNAIPGVNNNNFTTSFGIATAGTYRIKITDADNPSDFNISDPFTIVTSIPKGFNYSFEWDKSSPLPDGMPHPIGLAADGTSRIFIKLLRSSGKEVSKIVATINSVGDNYSGIDLLGKIAYANNHLTYNEDANAANMTSITWPANISANEFWFWLVAPNDFTQNLADQRSERKIKVDFTITYSDNSTEVISTDQTPIYIVRPPLFLVHGINGDAETFANMRYNVDGTPKFFNTDGAGGSIIANPLWKESQRLNLYNYGSFAQNAEVILGINYGDKYYNTFQAFLKAMHQKGYACNKVDYVAHSMGGCIARTIINLYVDSYKPPVNSGALYKYKNYSQGFINKLITLNTPHNGSYLADWVSDKYSNGLDNPLIYAFRAANLFGGFFVPNGSVLGVPLYQVSPAMHDLRAFNGGVSFPLTNVSNHLIGSEEDPNNILGETDIFSREDEWGYSLESIYHILLGINQFKTVHDYISQNYGNSEYLSNSDLVVPITSQLNYKEVTASNIYNNPFDKTSASILYGDVSYHVNHIDITDDINIGNRIMALLNAPINSTSGYFADNISQSPSYPNTGFAQSQNLPNTSSSLDSDINYVDVGHIQIINPAHFSTVYVDSTININLLVKDTNNLQKIQMVFQGEYYESYSKISNQTFNVKIHSNAIGYNQIVVQGLYDSSDYTIYHTDTATLRVKSLNTLKGFYITPKTQNLNRNQTFEPAYNAIYTNYIGTLNDNIDSLSFIIADTNVVKYIDSFKEFITKDTGTTYIVYNYKGFVDTGFIYISLPQENPNITFSGKVYLQGAYNTSTNDINNTLNSLGILESNALNQPFNNSSFNYSGTENVSSGFFASHPDIVDWVLLELRDSTSPSTVIATRAAFVKQDGTLVDIDGTTTQITFDDVPLGNYYVAVRHRNHLGIRSSVALDFSSGSASYDFTTAVTQAYQNQSYTSTVQIGSVWAMRAGNANSNNNVKYNGPANDQNQILNIKLAGSLGNVLNNVYAPEDINMNGNVKWNGPGNDQNFLLNTILNGSLSTIYLEQL